MKAPPILLLAFAMSLAARGHAAEEKMCVYVGLGYCLDSHGGKYYDYCEKDGDITIHECEAAAASTPNSHGFEYGHEGNLRNRKGGRCAVLIEKGVGASGCPGNNFEFFNDYSDHGSKAGSGVVASSGEVHDKYVCYRCEDFLMNEGPLPEEAATAKATVSVKRASHPANPVSWPTPRLESIRNAFAIGATISH